jgi:hypothetical protein
MFFKEDTPVAGLIYSVNGGNLQRKPRGISRGNWFLREFVSHSGLAPQYTY